MEAKTCSARLRAMLATLVERNGLRATARLVSLDPVSLSRFMAGKGLYSDSIDKVMAGLGLEPRPIATRQKHH